MNLEQLTLLAGECIVDELGGGRVGLLVRETPHGLEIEAAVLNEEPLPVQRRIVLKGLRMVANGREIGLDHVEAALGVAAGRSGGADIPGGRVELRRGKLVLLNKGQET